MSNDLDTSGAVKAYLQTREPQEALRSSMALAAGADADAEAEYQRLARAAGIPVDSVRENKQAVQQRLATPDARSLASNFPSTTAYLSKLDNARVAHDDVGTLTAIEQAMRDFFNPRERKPARIPQVMTGKEFGLQVRDLMERQGVDADTARALLSGVTVDNQSQMMGPGRGPQPTLGAMARGLFNMEQFRAASAGASLAAADVLGLQDARQSHLAEYRRARARLGVLTPEFETQGGEGVYSGVQSLVRNAPGIALSVAAGNPAPGLALAGGSVSAEAYGKYRERGGTPAQAGLGAVLEGGIEVGTEMLPMSFLVKKLGKAGAGEFIRGLLARELPSEQLATLAQDAVDTAIANPDKTWGQYAAERPGAAYQTLLATLVQSGAMGAVNTVARKATGYSEATERAEDAAQRAQEFAGLLEQSKLRARDPEAFQQFLTQVTESGAAPQEFYIDAEQLANTLNQSAMTLQELQAIAPTVAAQLQAAQLVPGADIRVPVAEFAAAPQEMIAPLVDHLRESPEAMSRSEAQAFLKDEGKRIQRDVESALADTAGRQQLQQDVAQVAQHFEAELNAVGKFRPEVNKAYAAVLGNFYATQAQRAGMSVDDFMERYQLRVAGKDVASGRQRLSQAPIEQLDQVRAMAAIPVAGRDEMAALALPQLRKAAEAAYKQAAAQGKITMSDGRQVELTPVGFKKTRSHSADRRALDLMPSIREILAGAVYLNSAQHQKANPGDAVKAWHYYGSKVNLDGKDLLARLVVRESVNGEIYYDSDLSGLEDVGGRDVDAAPAKPGAAPVSTDKGSVGEKGKLRQGERGTLSFGNDISSVPSIIALLEGADLSTFLHESGHLFLEVQADLAQRIERAGFKGEQETSDSQRQLVQDMDTILQWFGIEPTPGGTRLDTWARMSLEEKRDSHEKFARGFERYLMEGKAPNLQLQALFAKFRAWLVSVYRALANLDVNLSDEVRQVMGRMLASDEAIQEAEAARAMGPLFQTPEQAGMTPEEFADYQGLAQRATAAADQQLDERLMKDMRWLSRARDKALKARQAEVDEQRREVEREVRAQVMGTSVYRAWAFLTGKQDAVAPGTTAPEDLTGAESGKLRTSMVKDISQDAWSKLSERRMTSEERGLDPDIVAELFGFESGEQLVNELARVPPPAQVVQDLTDRQMLERYGDIASPEAMARAADEAVHNQLRARIIATELKALAKANRVKETGDSLLKQRDTVDVMARAAEDHANQAIARQRLKDLRPQQYAAAEARSARLAEQALGKDLPEAAMHKRNQLVNNFAAKAAYAAQQEVREGLEFFRKVGAGAQDKVAKTRDFDVVQAARAILADYGIGTRGEAAQAYMETIKANDPAMHQVLEDTVSRLTANAKPVRELTVEEFRGLREEIEALWHLAKRSRQMVVDGELIDLERAKLDLIGRMEEIGVPDRVPGEGMAVTEAERRLTMLQAFGAALRRVESWVGAKDGSEAMGPFRRLVWQPVKDGADAYRADKAKYLKRFRDLLKGLDVGRARIEAPELGYTFGHSRGGSGKAEILHALLHTGNESNKRKMLLGRQWGSVMETGELDTRRWDAFVHRMIDEGVLTRRDFEFVQGVWDLLEDMKPKAQKAHRDVFGRYFDEITAKPFTVQFPDGAVTYRGGYVPAIMDAEVVKDAKTRALQEDENSTLAYAFPSTPKGFTKARVEINRPLLLDLRHLSQHIDKVLLFSNLEAPIRDVRRLLTSREVSEPLHRIDPTAYDGVLTPWMNRAARQTVETKVPGDNNLMRFFSKARSRAGMAAMFANVANAAQQITGLSLAAVKVKPRYLLHGMVQWVRAPRQTSKAIAEASPYMEGRMRNEVAQMNEAIDDILLNPSTYEKAQAWASRHAYFLQSAVDNVISPVVWMGAYNQALEQGKSDKDAIRLADAAVRETQGSTLPEDVSRIETGNAFVRMFTQFASYFNMQANLLGNGFTEAMHEQGLRKGMGRGLYVFTMGFIVPAMVGEIIVQAFRGGPDDEDKDGSTLDDWLKAVVVMATARNALAMVPVAGPIINAGFNMANDKPYDDRISTSPAVSMIESAVRAPTSVYNAVAEDGNRRKAARDLATLISMTTGLPANAIARPVGYGLDVEQGNTTPTSIADAVRGYLAGTSSPASKN
jgi:hypothetical protein